MEVTTYRTDGEYLDARRPKQVAFVRSLQEDLERRDFTMNALAYHPKTGVIDCFGGQTDLKQGVIRCVEKPERRFQEDALRMMRALRFAAVYGFWIEEETRRALIQNWEMTTRLSAERMQMEWNRLLCGKAARKVLNEYQALLQPWFWGGYGQ